MEMSPDDSAVLLCCAGDTGESEHTSRDTAAARVRSVKTFGRQHWGRLLLQLQITSAFDDS